MNRGYHVIIEPPIYELLGWNMDEIVCCLEHVRIELPNIFDGFAETIEFDLISFENPFRNPYPVIGVHFESVEDNSGMLHDDSYINDKVEAWIEKIGLDNLKKKSSNLNYISWKKLEKIKAFPTRTI